MKKEKLWMFLELCVSSRAATWHYKKNGKYRAYDTMGCGYWTEDKSKSYHNSVLTSEAARYLHKGYDLEPTGKKVSNIPDRLLCSSISDFMLALEYFIKGKKITI